MSFTLKEIKVPSSDNIHILSGIMYIPDGEIKGILHIVHGMCEYIGRYAHIMEAIAEEGFICCGYDNLGHGKTARDDSELGFIAHRDGWKYLIKDVKMFEDAVRKLYPEKPLMLMGHSMGSFISRLAAEEYGDTLSKLIICGTGGPNPAAPFGLIITDIVKAFRGEKHISKTVDRLAFGAYNKRFEGLSEYDWITSEQTLVEKYAGDKYCTFKFTVSAMHDLIKLNYAANRKAWFRNLRQDLPILIISGTDDPVGNYGKGVRKVYDRLKAAGLNNIALKLYNGCRHEIHNDKCRAEVTEDIKAFIKQ